MKKLHDMIGLVAYPPILDIFIILIFTRFSPIGLGNLTTLSATLISLIFVTIIPLVPLPYYVRRGYVDMHVTNRRRRTLFYAIAIISYLMAAYIFLLFETFIMFYLVISFALIAFIIMIINFFWKISAHAAGIAGPITAIAYVFGGEFVLLHVFTFIIMFSRVELKFHTWEQVFAGALVSAIATLAVFYIFLPF